MITAAEVGERLETVRARCAAAGAADITIIGVTKGHGADAVRAAAGAGLDAVGESYAQELVAKHAELTADPPAPQPLSPEPLPPEPLPRIHFIGHLQRNKVRRLAGIVDVWQSVDRADLVDELARRAPGAEVMIQVDISGEQSKGGCGESELSALVSRATDAGLVVTGLMGIAPLAAPDAARPGFRRLRALVDEFGLAECSMGMSNDIEVAIEEGSTMLRIGTALFGPRPARS